MSEPGTTWSSAESARDWDPNRPVLASLLARREELEASFVDVGDGVARFTAHAITPEKRAAIAAAEPGTPQSALATLAAIPRLVTEPFDVGSLLAEQLTDAEQVMGALRDAPANFEVPVRTRTQPLVAVHMPADGIEVRLLVQVRRQPLRVLISMPLDHPIDADA